jgi:uncharacterized protein YneR
MVLKVTEAAVALYKTEWDFSSGDEIRIYPRYGGGGANPFSIGIAKTEPKDAGLSVREEGITFFIERDDLWLIGGRDLYIDESNGEITYQYEMD